MRFQQSPFQNKMDDQKQIEQNLLLNLLPQMNSDQQKQWIEGIKSQMDLKQQKLGTSLSATNLREGPWQNQPGGQLFAIQQGQMGYNNMNHGTPKQIGQKYQYYNQQQDVGYFMSEPEINEYSRSISLHTTTQSDIRTPFQLNYGPIQAYQDSSKQNKIEDSNIELKEHIKLIEELLDQDTNETISFRTNQTVDKTFEHDKSHMSSYMPQLGLSSIQGQENIFFDNVHNFSHFIGCDSNKKNILSSHSRATSTVDKNTLNK